MRLTFIGTRGNIRIASSVHRYNAALLVEVDGFRVLIDAGGDWRGRLPRLAPDALLVTHAHPDHAAALADGAPCPVYATAATHSLLSRFPLDRRVLGPAVRQHIGPLTVTAHQALHSLRAPAVGFRVERGRDAFFYVPDVLELVDRHAALRGVRFYVGDGATFGRAIVRRRNGEAFGHATIEAQLDWCADSGVRAAIFTHCGSRIVRREVGEIAEHVALLGSERGVEALVAHDGDVIESHGGGLAALGRATLRA